MGTYGLPRNVKGEGRILFIFSMKALIYASIGFGVGMIIYFILGFLGMGTVGIVIGAVLGIIGFLIGTFKMPDTTAFEITKKTGGENIDDVVKRYIAFKKKKNRVYVYKEVTKDE